MTLDKVLMPVPDRNPDVFERQWPLRVADIDRYGRLRLDATARHIQDAGQDQLREWGFEATHPLWGVRRAMIDVIKPIEFPDTLRLRRWCSGTSTRWCEKRVRIDGRRGGLIESEAFWININPDNFMPSRIGDDFLDGLRRTSDVDRLRWKAYLKNNSVYWSGVEEYRFTTPEQLNAPLRITIEHEAPVALGDKLEIITHLHPAGTTEAFGPGLIDRPVTTLTYVAGDRTKAIASIFALSA
jgi:acyl-ACP thioesterase